MIMGSMCAVRNECYTWISTGVMMQRNCMSSRDVKCIYAEIDKSIQIMKSRDTNQIQKDAQQYQFFVIGVNPMRGTPDYHDGTL